MENSTSTQKGFTLKHLIVMALGNIIGSGIFLASGTVISLTGPSSALAYCVGGLLMLLEVMFITEMSVVNPAPGSFRVHASEIFGRGVGFVNGWMFWCSGVLGMAGEVTAAAIFSRFWFPNIPLWIFCLLYSALMTIINFLDVRGLSKIEIWLASVKVIALVAFILFGILSIFRILPTAPPGGAATGFSSFKAFFPHGARGFLSCMLLVLFSYTGTGIIGLAAADTSNPEKNMPPAIYIISASVIVLYSFAVLFIVVMTPWNTVSASQSPFVAILQNKGVAVAGGVLNFIVLTAALSGLNSSMYSASRMLYSLSKDKQGPKLFLATNKNSVPVYALGATSLVLALTSILSYVLPESIFIILIGASGFMAMINWLTISVTHIFYRKKTLREHPEKLKYRVPWYPVTSILAVLLIIGVLVTSPLYPGQVVSLVGGAAIIVLLVLVYAGLKANKIVD